MFGRMRKEDLEERRVLEIARLKSRLENMEAANNQLDNQLTSRMEEIDLLNDKILDQATELTELKKASSEGPERELIDFLKDKFDENFKAWLKIITPVLLMRGRQLLEELKAKKPEPCIVKRVRNVPPSKVEIDPWKNGILVQAYVVESRADFQCLKMAMAYQANNPNALPYDFGEIINPSGPYPILFNAHPIVIQEQIDECARELEAKPVKLSLEELDKPQLTEKASESDLEERRRS